MKQIIITLNEENTLHVSAPGIPHYEVLGALHGAIAAVQGVSYIPPTEAESIQKDLLNTEEAMKLLRCSKRTMHNWRKSGKLPFKTIGSKIYYRITDLKKMI